MVGMGRCWLVAAAMCGATLCGTSAWAKTDPTPCLAPLPSDAQDPDIRNISVLLDADGSHITVQGCIVSNQHRLAGLGVTYSLFDQQGNFLAEGGTSLGAQSEVNGGQPGQPKIIAIAAAGLFIARPHPPLLGTLLAQVQWTPCQEQAGQTCTGGALMSTTFLRDAAIVPPPTVHRQGPPHKRHEVGKAAG